MSNRTTPSVLSSASSRPSTHLATPVSEVDLDAGVAVDQGICTKEHVMYCFDVLVDHLQNKGSAKSTGKSERGGPGPEPRFRNAQDDYALFVTWNTNSHLRPDSNRKPALRGCIGNFSPMPLEEGLRTYALVSALEDHRFSPIKASELPHLSCNVSLLTPFESIPTPLSWTPGRHGIHLTFPHPSTGKSLSATYLPEIALEQGWTREQALLSAIAKAGYRGSVKVGDAVWNSLRVKVYESVKATAGWDEYLAWKAVLEDGDEVGSGKSNAH